MSLRPASNGRRCRRSSHRRPPAPPGNKRVPRRWPPVDVVHLVVHRQSGQRLQRHMTILPRKKKGGRRTQRAKGGMAEVVNSVNKDDCDANHICATTTARMSASAFVLRFHPHRIGSRFPAAGPDLDSRQTGWPRPSAKASTANRSLAKWPGKSSPMPAASASRQV